MEQQGINRHMRGACIDCGGPRKTAGVGRCKACYERVHCRPHPHCRTCNKQLETDNKTGLCAHCRYASGATRLWSEDRLRPSTTHAGPCRPLSAEQRERVALLQDAVCAVYGVAPAVLRAVSRYACHVEPRQMYMFLLTTKADLSATQAGALIGRDHATVLHGKRRAAERIQSDRLWADAYRAIRDHYRAARQFAPLGTPAPTPRTLLDDYCQARRLQHRDVVSYAS